MCVRVRFIMLDGDDCSINGSFSPRIQIVMVMVMTMVMTMVMVMTMIVMTMVMDRNNGKTKYK